MSHTPGPWAVIASEDLPDRMQVIHVADVQANARLIAAAPDLLAALQRVVRAGELENQMNWEALLANLIADMVEPAIAKATSQAARTASRAP